VFFELGLCLLLESTAAELYGSLIYVPKVTVLTNGYRNRFQVFLLSDSTLGPAQAAAVSLDSLALAQTPLFDLGKIAYVEGSTDEIGLNPGAKIGESLQTKFKGMSLAVPFVVLADGVRIFLGTFVSDAALASYPGPIIMMGTLKNDSMILRHANLPSDPLKDPRIVATLTETGKLIP